MCRKLGGGGKFNDLVMSAVDGVLKTIPKRLASHMLDILSSIETRHKTVIFKLIKVMRKVLQTERVSDVSKTQPTTDQNPAFVEKQEHLAQQQM